MRSLESLLLLHRLRENHKKIINFPKIVWKSAGKNRFLNHFMNDEWLLSYKKILLNFVASVNTVLLNCSRATKLGVILCSLFSFEPLSFNL